MKIAKVLAAVALFVLTASMVFAEMQPGGMHLYNRPTGVSCNMPDLASADLNPSMFDFVGRGISTCNSMNKGSPICQLQCTKEVKRLAVVRHTKIPARTFKDCVLMDNKELAGLNITACLAKAHQNCRPMNNNNLYCASRCEKNAVQKCRQSMSRY